MADDAAIRRTNLNRYMRAAQVTPTDMAARYYGRVSYWRDLARDTNKAFGEKAARRIEEAAQLPRLWLDTPDAPLENVHRHPHAGEPAAPYAPGGWPWSVELWQHVQKADEDHLAHAEQVLRAFFGLPPISAAG